MCMMCRQFFIRNKNAPKLIAPAEKSFYAHTNLPYRRNIVQNLQKLRNSNIASHSAGYTLVKISFGPHKTAFPKGVFDES